jgi:hypothetical protein
VAWADKNLVRAAIFFFGLCLLAILLREYLPVEWERHVQGIIAGGLLTSLISLVAFTGTESDDEET